MKNDIDFLLNLLASEEEMRRMRSGENMKPKDIGSFFSWLVSPSIPNPDYGYKFPVPTGGLYNTGTFDNPPQISFQQYSKKYDDSFLKKKIYFPKEIDI